MLRTKEGVDIYGDYKILNELLVVEKLVKNDVQILLKEEVNCGLNETERAVPSI